MAISDQLTELTWEEPGKHGESVHVSVKRALDEAINQPSMEGGQKLSSLITVQDLLQAKEIKDPKLAKLLGNVVREWHWTMEHGAAKLAAANTKARVLADDLEQTKQALKKAQDERKLESKSQGASDYEKEEARRAIRRAEVLEAEIRELKRATREPKIAIVVGSVEEDWKRRWLEKREEIKTLYGNPRIPFGDRSSGEAVDFFETTYKDFLDLEAKAIYGDDVARIDPGLMAALRSYTGRNRVKRPLHSVVPPKQDRDDLVVTHKLGTHEEILAAMKRIDGRVKMMKSRSED